MRSFSKPAQRVRQPGFPSPFRPMKLSILMAPHPRLRRDLSPLRGSSLPKSFSRDQEALLSHEKLLETRPESTPTRIPVTFSPHEATHHGDRA